LAEWRQFSIGSGTKWIFDREVLSRGLAGRPSDFGALLSNTFRWLAEPSVAGAALGGWRTRADRLEPPNASETVKARYKATPYEPSALGHAPTDARRMFRGLIGARTTYSAGHSGVAEYARAARASGLDFVVFLEDFERMSREKLSALAVDCSRSSGPDLLLLPGFSITNNIGNHLFFFSPHPEWPPDSVLTGPQRNRLYMQEQAANGEFTGYGTQFLPWVLGTYAAHDGQVGYYNFADSPTGVRLYDARLYSMVGLRYYRQGRLVEDLLDAFLTTAASTIAPAPVGVDEVDSADELAQEARSGHAATYGKAASLDAEARDGLVHTALRWSNQYDAMPVFVSSGPRILSWPDCVRASTYGAEGFVPERAVMNSWLSVASDVGLEEIRIYDGDRLFRRIELHGSRTFEQMFVLDGSIQRNLVVVARDQRGGTAVGFPRRSWSDGTPAPVFCSDHVNDCGGLLAHGPWSLPLNKPPVLPVDVGGWTWDGGPPAALPATGSQETWPEIFVGEGSFNASRLDPIPRLEFADEGAVGVEAYGREAYDPRLLRVINAWNTYGPIDTRAPLFENTQRFRQWLAASVGVPATGYAADAVRTGIGPALFTDTLRFRRESTVRSLMLSHLHPPRDAMLVVGGTGQRRSVDVGAVTNDEIPVPPGSWFAVYGRRSMNAYLFENRGEEVHLSVHRGVVDVVADVRDRRFRSGDEYTSEISSLAFPLDKPITSDRQIARYVDYLRDPGGLRVLRGTRAQSPGLLEVAIEDGAVELSVPRAEGVEGLTLPLRVTGLNPRWSVGLLQEDGYSAGFYGTGHNRFRSLGVEPGGAAYVPMYVDRAETRLLAGHAIVADPAGHDLFIQVTCLGGTPFRWHISVNNPTGHSITTVLRQAMKVPGLDFPEQRLTLPPGEYVAL
jgi:hypothetical protein